MNRFLFFVSLFLFCISCKNQLQTEEFIDIQIARDQWGVPHIMAKTDAQVAYGLAWAQCEDDFVTLQELMAACKGKLGEIKGKEGITADFGIQFMGLKEIATNKYNTDVTGDFKEYLESFVSGVNAYAKTHPKEVLLNDLFPLEGSDIITGYLLGSLEISHAGKDLIKILNGTIAKELKPDVEKGSNAFAFSSKMTKDGKTYLAINSHQPLEGWYSWYEAHLMSNEGLNILGGTFAGGICIFHGVNENLGWAHTVNHGDFSDVYRLEMNPNNENQYKFDGEWLELKKKTYTSWLKLSDGIKVPITQSIYESKYGPTFKTDNGVFAWRFVVGQNIKMAEQWFRMNKAQNFTEFKSALEMRGLASLNIVYADKSDTIFYVSNGRFPKRNPKYQWQSILPGNTSQTLWGDELIPFQDLPQVLNPESGWVFNTNNTPFSSSSDSNNPKETDLNQIMGFQPSGMENNRSVRFLELVSHLDSIDYLEFKGIKYDQQYPARMTTRTAVNLELLFELSENKYPEIADAIKLLKQWDRKSSIDNKTAALYILSWMYLNERREKEGRATRGSYLTEEDCVFGIKKAKKELLNNYGSLQIALGEIQRHIRGKVNIPIGGAPDVLAAMYSKKYDDKTYRARAGESYIELVRFGQNGVEIETINSFGSSSRLDSVHSTSQMEMFTKQQLKTMTLNKEEVLKKAVRIYSPLKIMN